MNHGISLARTVTLHLSVSFGDDGNETIRLRNAVVRFTCRKKVWTVKGSSDNMTRYFGHDFGHLLRVVENHR